MWRARVASAYDWLASRSLAGTDAWGNKYYTQPMTGRADRRFVEFRDGTPATDKMPVQWWAWLHGRRDAPPTAAELERAAADQDALVARVAALRAEDAKERLRGIGAGLPGSPRPGTGPGARDGRAPPASTRAERQRTAILQLASTRDVAHSDRPRSQEGECIQATTRMGTEQRATSVAPLNEDPTGVGDDFQPGSWIPPSR